MNFNFIKKLPIPLELKKMLPINKELQLIKIKNDNKIKDIISGKDNSFLIIVGPCSAHDRDAVLEYVDKLKNVQNKIKDKIFIVPRIYTNKPRTDASGYKGLLHQPNPNENPNFLDGLIAIRQLHMDVLKYTGFSSADEILYPENFRYINDLISYAAIGARSVENQFHRLCASGLDIACGMKNPTSGNLKTLINSIKAANDKHAFIYRGWEVETPGNPYTHAILRGYIDWNGESHPNYNINNIKRLYKLFTDNSISNSSVIIDTNHSNSNKNYKKQVEIAMNIVDYKNKYPEISKFIRGLMIESFLVEGCQNINEGTYGKSITDPCLGFKETEELLYRIADKL